MEKSFVCFCVGLLLCTQIVAKEVVQEREGLSFSNSISSEKIYRWQEGLAVTYGDVRPINDLSSQNLVIMNLPLSASERLKRETITPLEAKRVLAKVGQSQMQASV